MKKISFPYYEAITNFKNYKPTLGFNTISLKTTRSHDLQQKEVLDF